MLKEIRHYCSSSYIYCLLRRIGVNKMIAKRVSYLWAHTIDKILYYKLPRVIYGKI